jgi:hypothetical protein
MIFWARQKTLDMFYSGTSGDTDPCSDIYALFEFSENAEVSIQVATRTRARLYALFDFSENAEVSNA